MFKLILVFIAAVSTYSSATAQDILLNILTKNSGNVNRKESVFLEVTVCNTSSTIAVPVYKLRPQINVPVSIVSIEDTGHILPTGWTITYNSDAVIRLSNGTDMVPAHECRTILIAIRGNAIGGPSTILGNLLFSNGVSPGSESGAATPGDNPADNSSATTIKVIK
jgi:hypothetical protein